ncbi:unnamed protein product [Notodromas monacha]|uniref:Aminopeptidase n=1 Tax=Notodromas monacha TaxID=399045 RepID=A0A7R9BVN4_9CRUS|nr:unnamed protein product [Notodromas monacha]CAG0922228.1 unnamed protein product [Notodromas monacha]
MAKSSMLRNGRLPRDTLPLRYEVLLAPDLNRSKLSGSVQIDAVCVKETAEVVFHSDPMLVWDRVAVSSSNDCANFFETGIERSAEDQAVRLSLPRKLKPEERFRVAVDFSGQFSEKLVGFYRATYAEDGNAKHLGVTHLWPTEARRMFPCYDEPDMKAEFLIKVQRLASMTALSNMPVKATRPCDDGCLLESKEEVVEDEFEVTPKMSTYLLAVTVSEFQSVTATTDNQTLVRVWMPPSLKRQAKLAIDIAPVVLKFYEKLFDIRYPLPKMDLFVAPDLAYGAMENWGLITYRAQSLLFDPAVSTAKDQVQLASTVSHEIAHQWFGNLVTPSWWTDLWLNEGFASYMEVIPIQEILTKWNVGESCYSEMLRGVLVTDSLMASHSISKTGVTTTNEIMELFDDISYRKGSSLIRMLVAVLGRDAFLRALSGYLAAFAYGNASQDDLWTHLSKADSSRLPKNALLKDIMDSWTLQTGDFLPFALSISSVLIKEYRLCLGYPVVTVARKDSGDGHELHVSQKRFFLYPLGAPEKDRDSVSSWWVPLNFASGTRNNSTRDWKDARADAWLEPNSEYKSSQKFGVNEWIVVNVGHTGFYRVNYDDLNWKLLAEQLKENAEVIDPVNRAQILDDAFMLARAGYLEYDLAVDLMDYLPAETSYMPWSAALKSANFFIDMLDDGEEEHAGDLNLLKNYLKKTLTPALDSMEENRNGQTCCNETSGQYENVTSIWLETLLAKWGCDLGHEKSVKFARDEFSRWMTSYDPENPDKPIIDPNMKEMVYCCGINLGGKAEWDFAAKHLSRTSVATERDLILSALACTQNVSLLSEYAELVIKGGTGTDSNPLIPKADSMTALLNIAARSNVGGNLMLDLVTDEWPRVQSLFGTGRLNVGRLFVQVAKGLSSTQKIEKIKKFSETNKSALHGANLLMQTAEEFILSNIRWQTGLRAKFMKALSRKFR